MGIKALGNFPFETRSIKFVRAVVVVILVGDSSGLDAVSPNIPPDPGGSRTVSIGGSLTTSGLYTIHTFNSSRWSLVVPGAAAPNGKSEVSCN